MTPETEPHPDPATAVDEELRRAGHDPECNDCLRALAIQGRAACLEHYVPVPERDGR